ncbi:hypothetical protein H0G86_006494 [Trichoderma simmonsii]|uniref:Uncharacterized protein n=1 Tax=Trichoderma simmonsii TaxID=1491479 RepID=A0A8G0LER1_9HYPO|nr:hypothetical protein H0G86_006494 [Trichoderma simmonsii]
MSHLSIPLIETKDEGGEYRARNAKGKDFRDVIQLCGNSGTSLISREILLVCSGKLGASGKGTLLLFRFMFTSLENDTSQRFTSAKITIEFSDERSRNAYDPEVVSIWPARQQRFDIVTETTDNRRGGNIALRTEGQPLQFEAGRQWMVSTTSMIRYCTKLSAVKFNTRSNFEGTWHSVIWQLNEHSSRKEGVPHLFQTAVIVRRIDDGKFKMKIKIETTTNTQAALKNMMKKLVGLTQSEPVDPVNIDSGLFMLKDIDIPELAEMRSKGEIELDKIHLEDYVGLMHKENK